jgi:hypothetical protein
MAALAAVTWINRSTVEAPSGHVDGAFSEARAFETLTRLVADHEPHVSGTAANRRMRDRVVGELKAAGYSPEIQSAIGCGPVGRTPGCTAVENIIAVHKGTGTGKAVLALSHYDSKSAGAGVGDDAAGVAVMVELARHMAALSTRNDVIFLITDGEETGMRGAIAFAQQHPLMNRVGTMVNLEARGAAGRSVMFETGEGNAKLIEMYARAVPRPGATSLSYEIYKRLPNDTDFSIFRRAGITGFNLAFTGAASLYHSQRDTLRTLDRRSLQHQGEQAFALALALSDADLASLGGAGNAAYFDVFGRRIVRWPAAATMPLALAAIAGLIVLIIRHRAAFTPRGTLWAILAIVLAPAILFAIGMLLSYPLGIWPGVHPLDHPTPWAGRVAMIAAIWLAILPLARLIRRRTDARVMLLLTWGLFALLAAVVAVTMTGAAYLLLVPVLVFVIVGLPESFARRHSLAWAGTAGAGMFAVLLISLALLLEVTLGFDMTHYKILILAPLAMALLPLIAGEATRRPHSWWLELGVAALVVLCATLAARAPAYTPDRPRGLNLTLYDDGTAAPVWQAGFVGRPDIPWLSSSGFNVVPQPLKQFGLVDISAYTRTSGESRLPPPVLTVLHTSDHEGLRTVTASLRPARGGVGLGIGVPAGPGVRSIRVNGEELLPSGERSRPVLVRFWGFIDRDLSIEITVDPKAQTVVSVFEQGPLPDTNEAKGLVSSRPANAAPAFQGDAAMVSFRWVVDGQR